MVSVDCDGAWTVVEPAPLEERCVGAARGVGAGYLAEATVWVMGFNGALLQYLSLKRQAQQVGIAHDWSGKW